MEITELIGIIIDYLNDKINQESEILWMKDDGYWFLSNDECFHTDWIPYYIVGLNKALFVYRNKEKYEIGHWQKDK